MPCRVTSLIRGHSRSHLCLWFIIACALRNCDPRAALYDRSEAKEHVTLLQMLSTLAAGLSAVDFAARDLLKNREYNSYAAAAAGGAASMRAAGSAQQYSYLPRGGRSASDRQQRRRQMRQRPQSRDSQVRSNIGEIL